MCLPVEQSSQVNSPAVMFGQDGQTRYIDEAIALCQLRGNTPGGVQMSSPTLPTFLRVRLLDGRGGKDDLNLSTCASISDTANVKRILVCKAMRTPQVYLLVLPKMTGLAVCQKLQKYEGQERAGNLRISKAYRIQPIVIPS